MEVLSLCEPLYTVRVVAEMLELHHATVNTAARKYNLKIGGGQWTLIMF
jgi:hypothetical protein